MYTKINQIQGNKLNMKNIQYTIILLMSILLCISTLDAGSKKRRGTAGAQELLIPVGARNIAMSNAFVAGVTGVEAAASNPAGVSGMLGNGQVMFSHTIWLADIGVNYVAVASKFKGESIFGITARTLDFGDIPITTTEFPDGTGSTFSPNYVTLGFLFSKQMTDRIRFGADFKIVEEGIMRESATGFVLDAGVQYASSSTGLRLGAALKNLGMNMNFDGPDLEEFHTPEGSQPGTSSEPRRVHLQDFEMPTTLELGLSYEEISVGPGEINLAASFLNNNFSFDEYRFGGEFTLMDILALRGGLTISHDPEPYGTDGIEGTSDDADDKEYEYKTDEFIWGPTFGFGINTSTMTNLNLSIDYAFRSTAIFDDTQWVTISVGF